MGWPVAAIHRNTGLINSTKAKGTPTRTKTTGVGMKAIAALTRALKVIQGIKAAIRRAIATQPSHTHASNRKTIARKSMPGFDRGGFFASVSIQGLSSVAQIARSEEHTS